MDKDGFGRFAAFDLICNASAFGACLGCVADGIRRAAEGQTTPEEVLRVAGVG